MPTHVISVDNTPADSNTGNVATEVTVYQLKTVLTDAQIKALPTTSIELVPAMSAGQLPMVHGGLVVIKNVAGAYANANINAYMSVVYTKDGIVLTDAAFLRTSNLLALTGAANTMFQFSPRVRWDNAFPALEGTDVYSPLENFDGSGLSLFIDNAGSGDFTGGNAANTLEVTVFYSIVDL
jgi:hypothetical protein